MRPSRENLGPREPAAYGERQGDGGVEVGAGDPAGDVDAERHRERPAQGDEKPVAHSHEDRGGTFGAPRPGQGCDRHGDGAAPEGDEHERAEELREAFAPQPTSALEASATTADQRFDLGRHLRLRSTAGSGHSRQGPLWSSRQHYLGSLRIVSRDNTLRDLDGRRDDFEHVPPG